MPNVVAASQLYKKDHECDVGSCKGCGVATSKVPVGVTCCELSGDVFLELAALFVGERETMKSSGKVPKIKRL